jgi:hypothetical protein
MHKFTLSAVISAVLLGSSAVAIAQEPSQAAESQTPATQAPNTSRDASGNSGGQAPVGTTPSNVDEKSSSGSYYPYSSGTVGDDPAKPEATTVPVQAGQEGDRSSATTTGDWMAADTNGDEQLSKAEVDKAWPTVGARFDDIDVDGDKQATRDELRSWHESQKTRMEADQPAAAPASTAPAAGTVPDAQSPTNTPPVTPSSDEPTTSDAGKTNQ